MGDSAGRGRGAATPLAHAVRLRRRSTEAVRRLARGALAIAPDPRPHPAADSPRAHRRGDPHAGLPSMWPRSLRTAKRRSACSSRTTGARPRPFCGPPTSSGSAIPTRWPWCFLPITTWTASPSSWDTSSTWSTSSVGAANGSCSSGRPRPRPRRKTNGSSRRSRSAGSVAKRSTGSHGSARGRPRIWRGRSTSAGAFWNTRILVSPVATLATVGAATVPRLNALLERLDAVSDMPEKRRAIRQAFALAPRPASPATCWSVSRSPWLSRHYPRTCSGRTGARASAWSRACAERGSGHAGWKLSASSLVQSV